MRKSWDGRVRARWNSGRQKSLRVTLLVDFRVPAMVLPMICVVRFPCIPGGRAELLIHEDVLPESNKQSMGRVRGVF